MLASMKTDLNHTETEVNNRPTQLSLGEWSNMELKAVSYPFTASLDLWCIVQQLQHVLMQADHPPTAP